MYLSTSRISLLLLAVLGISSISSAQTGEAIQPIVFKSDRIRQQITPLSTHQPVQFTALIPGNVYQLNVSVDLVLPGCTPQLNMVNGPSGEGKLTFTAVASSETVLFDYPCEWDLSNSPSHYVSLSCLSCPVEAAPMLNSPDLVLNVSPMGYEDAVRDVLIGGNCFDVTGITFCGSANQIGVFSNGNTNVGFSTGVILATGPIDIAPGPNDQNGAGAVVGGCASDSDLSNLSSGSLNDVAKIEFDFTPTNPVVSFEYVFASEEYCEYVGSEFNDVFGFFISGPGIPGTQNLAIIPASGGTPVTINNVNHTSYSGLYVNNQPASSGNLCGQGASSAPSVNELQYDGFTRKFTAVANVIPCQTYHIKLAIADVTDGRWDSAVFLKEGSFSAGANASVHWVVNGQPDAPETYESCGLVQLVFDRVGGNLNQPVNVQFTVSGTATSGADYSPIPTSVTIPPGQTSFTLPVNIINDLIAEGQENIIVTLNNLCACSMPQVTLNINDLPVLMTEPDTVFLCGPSFGVLEATVNGGVPPYTYNWSNNGGTSSTAGFFVNTSTTYRVTITDACGKTIVQNIRAQVNPQPRAQLLPPAPQLCPEGGTGTLMVNFIGAGPFQLTYSINDVEQIPIENISQNPFPLTVTQPGIYRVVSVVDSAGCQGYGSGLQIVTVSQLALTATVTNNVCSGDALGAINTTVIAGQAPYTYAWSGPQVIPANTADPVNLMTGTYVVTVTDAVGCTRTGSYTVTAGIVFNTYLTQTSSPDCAAPNGGSLNLEVTGGAGGYTYQWSNGAMVQDAVGLAAGTYTVTVRDSGGCTTTASYSISDDVVRPVAVAAVSDELDCIVTEVGLTGLGSSAGTQFTYQWIPPAGATLSGPTDSLNTQASQPGMYQLVVTNTSNGCVSKDTVTVLSNILPPVANAGPDLILTCAVNQVTLNGTGSSAGNNGFNYLWTASNGGVLAGGENTTQPIASAVGTYTIQVTDLLTGCTATDAVLVTENKIYPTAAATTNGQITCTQNTVTLNGAGSTPSNVVYHWTTINGLIISGGDSATPTVGEAGDYTLIVTNPNNGCTDDATVVVTVDQTAPSAIVIANGELNCQVSQLTINGANSSPTTQFVWTTDQNGHFVSGQNTLTPVVDEPGVYTLEITNPSNNCKATASVQITENITPPVADAGAPGVLNCYNNNQLTVGDPNAFILPGVSYQWQSSTGSGIVGAAINPSATVNAPATYTLLVTNQLNYCTSTASVIISQNNTYPTATIATPGQINCTTPFVQLNGNGSTTGPGIDYAWTSSTGLMPTGGTTLMPVVTVPDSYTLVVTNNSNGCTSSASTTVSANLNLPVVTVAAPTPVTCTVTEVMLNANGTSSGTNFSYQWGTLDGVILSGANGLTPMVGAAGTYTLVVSNSNNNCTAVQNITVPANNTLPTVNAGPNQILSCLQPQLTLNGSGSTGGNFTYQWTSEDGNFVSGDNTLTPVINAPGTYILEITNTTTGCKQSAGVLINEDASEPVVQLATAAPLTCTINTVTLNATGSSSGTNYEPQWSGPGIVSGQNTLSPVVNAGGLYTLAITNTDNGCVTQDTVTVPVNRTAPVADAGPDQILNCYHPQLQLDGPNMSTGFDFIYSWTGPGILSGEANANPVINQPGQYAVTVTNTVNGCTHTDIVNLDANFNTPTVDAGPGDTLTCSENYYQTVPVVSGPGPFTYEWGTNGGNFQTAPTVLNPILNGVGYYYLTVTNTVSGCTATDQLQVVNSNDFPVADAGVAAQLTCTTTQLTLDGTGSSENGPYTYQWIPVAGGNIIGGANTLHPMVNEPGTYSLEVRDTTNGCISNSAVTITQNIQNPVIDAGLPQTLICSTTSLQLSGTVSSNGNFIYQWTAANGGNIMSGDNTLQPQINAVGTYTLQVTNLLNGCTQTDMVNILADQNAPVVSVAQPDTLNCIQTEVVLDATVTNSASMMLIWNTPNGTFTDLSNPLRPEINAPGVYQLLVTNPDNNCSSLANVTVYQDIVKPIARAGQDTEIDCTNIIATLDGSTSSTDGNFYYQWTTPDGTLFTGINTLTPAVTSAGSYVLNILNTDNGCTSSDVVVVTEDLQKPVVSVITPALISCFAAEVTLDGSNSSSGSHISYSWSTQNGNILSGENTPQALVNAPGEYVFYVQNMDNGCASTISTLVSENTTSPSVQILPPNNLTCSVQQVTITALAENASQYVFGWSTGSGNIVSGGASLNLTVDEPGGYNILVINNLNGCMAFASTNVLEVTEYPEDLAYSLDPPGCRDNDGAIRFDTVIGGVGPYIYSIDGGFTFTSTVAYGGVQPGTYELLVQDINGCEYSEILQVPQAPDPGISISPQFSLSLGDSLRLEAELPSGYPLEQIDTIIWTPTDYLQFDGTSINDLLHPICKPFHTVRYEVKVISKDGGCEATDRIYISVDTEPLIYIPNVFYPDDPTGNNNLIMIFANDEREQIKEVHTFQIYDRWGNRVHQADHFKPNDISHAWNGRMGGAGKAMDPAVFVYVARVELIDGRIIQYQGDITLVK